MNIDFFFSDNTTTPVASFETAFTAQSYLLQYMFRKDFPVNPTAPYAGPLSGWSTFGVDATVANITIANFEFGPEDELKTTRCTYINELLVDPENGV